MKVTMSKPVQSVTLTSKEVKEALVNYVLKHERIAPYKEVGFELGVYLSPHPDWQALAGLNFYLEGK